jgi:hypothetical protein
MTTDRSDDLQQAIKDHCGAPVYVVNHDRRQLCAGAS